MTIIQIANNAVTTSSSGGSVIIVDYIGKSGRNIPSNTSFFRNEVGGSFTEGMKYFHENIKYYYIYTSGKWTQKPAGTQKFLSTTSFKVLYWDNTLQSIDISNSIVICKEDNKAYFYNGTEIKGVVSN